MQRRNPIVATGLFIAAAPDEAMLGAAQAALADALAQGGPVRQVFLYGEAVRLAAPDTLPPPVAASARRFAAACADGAASLLACQSALERLGIAPGPDSPFVVGTLGQWFDVLHELDSVRSIGR